MGGSTGVQTFFSQMVPPGHWSSSLQTSRRRARPALGAPASGRRRRRRRGLGLADASGLRSERVQLGRGGRRARRQHDRQRGGASSGAGAQQRTGERRADAAHWGGSIFHSPFSLTKAISPVSDSSPFLRRTFKVAVSPFTGRPLHLELPPLELLLHLLQAVVDVAHLAGQEALVHQGVAVDHLLHGRPRPWPSASGRRSSRRWRTRPAAAAAGRRWSGSSPGAASRCCPRPRRCRRRRSSG